MISSSIPSALALPEGRGAGETPTPAPRDARCLRWAHVPRRLTPTGVVRAWSPETEAEARECVSADSILLSSYKVHIELACLVSAAVRSICVRRGSAVATVGDNPERELLDRLGLRKEILERVRVD